MTEALGIDLRVCDWFENEMIAYLGEGDLDALYMLAFVFCCAAVLRSPDCHGVAAISAQEPCRDSVSLFYGCTKH
jgi:hypothetical protein